MNRNLKSEKAKAYRGQAMEGFIAKWYAKTTLKDIDEYKLFAVRIDESVPNGSTILEVAPGPGFLAVELAKTGKFDVTGLDISQTFVGIARENAANAGVNAKFHQGNAAGMPFEDETFDFIICRAAFKNFADPVGALCEMKRVLKPGGAAWIDDLRRDVSNEAIAEYVDKMNLNWLNSLITKWTFRFMLTKRAYTKDELAAFVSQAEFNQHEIQGNPMSLEVRLKK